MAFVDIVFRNRLVFNEFNLSLFLFLLEIIKATTIDISKETPIRTPYIRRANEKANAGLGELKKIRGKLRLEIGAENGISFFGGRAIQTLDLILAWRTTYCLKLTIQSSRRLDIAMLLMVTSCIFRSRE